MIDANITAPEEPNDPAAALAADRAWVNGEITGDEIDRARAAFEAALGRPMRSVLPRTDDLHEIPEPDEDVRGAVAEMRDLLAAAADAGEGDSNDAEIDALRDALVHALTRWPEIADGC